MISRDITYRIAFPKTSTGALIGGNGLCDGRLAGNGAHDRWEASAEAYGGVTRARRAMAGLEGEIRSFALQ